MKIDDLEVCEFLYFATTRCNCRCRHCNPSLYTGKNREMTSSEMIKHYEMSKFLQGNTISVAGGEPFLKEDLDEFIVYLDKKKIPCIISTNGWFTERVERLLNKLEDNKTVQFAISIDGTEEMHDEIRRCKGIYKRAIETVRLIKAKNFNVQINMVVQKGNIKLLEEFDSFFNSLNVPVAYIPEIFVGDDTFNFTTAEIKEIYPYISRPRDRKYILSKGKYTITNCHAGKTTWLIDCNGDVYTCCGGYYKDNREKYIIGNLYDSDFDAIFTSRRKEQICRNVVDTCEGCLLPRDIERETKCFGLSTQYTKSDIMIWQEKLSTVCFLDDYSLDNNNWNDLEQNDYGTFRWMKGKVASLFIKNNKASNKLVIKYLNIVGTNINKDVRLRIYLDEYFAGEIRCEEGVHTIEFPLSETLKDEIIEVKLHTNLEWIPKECSMGMDARVLGLGIYYVKLN